MKDYCLYELDEKKRFRIFLEEFSHCIEERFTIWLLDNGFFRSPASSKYHGAYEGGLFDHSYIVTKTLLSYTNKLELKWERGPFASPVIVGMFHDLCKIDAYKEATAMPVMYEKRSDQIITGHGDKSVMLLSQFINLTEEEMMCILFHMGAYEKESWVQYGRAVEKYPNVLYTHTADMAAARIEGI